MQILTDYLKLQEELFAYFGYKEDWRAFPVDDARSKFWRIEGGRKRGEVQFSETEDRLRAGEDGQDREGECLYSHQIFTYVHLKQYVYRGADWTMILVDTRTDGNIFLRIFDNAKEVK